MTFTTSNFLLLAAIILIFSILITKTGYKFGVPSLLIFLIVGMIFGEDGLGIHYDNYNIAQFIGMIALTIILFTGGMGTRFNDIRPILGPGLTLSTVGVLLTTVFTGFFIFGIGQVFNDAITLPLTFAILLAATMSSTDSASVFSIIRSQKMKMHHNPGLLHPDAGVCHAQVLTALGKGTGAASHHHCGQNGEGIYVFHHFSDLELEPNT